MQYYTIANKVGRDLLLTANEADGNLAIRTAISGPDGISDSQLWRKELVDGNKYYLVSKEGEKKLQFGSNINDQVFVSLVRGSKLVFSPDPDGFNHIQDVDTELVLAVPKAGEGAEVIGYTKIVTPDQM